MVKKLTKHGNSLALVIDRPILDLLKIDPETPLDVSTDGRQLIVAPAKPTARRKKFDAAQEGAQKRYGSWPSESLGRTSWNRYSCLWMRFWRSTSSRSSDTAGLRDSATLLDSN